MSTGGFEMLQHILGTREGHTHVQGCVCAKEIPEKVLNLSPVANFEPLSKQEMKAKAELQIAYQVAKGIPQNIHTHFGKGWRLIGSRHLRKSWSNH